jgi:uncharacterized protein YkwD
MKSKLLTRNVLAMMLMLFLLVSVVACYDTAPSDITPPLVDSKDPPIQGGDGVGNGDFADKSGGDSTDDSADVAETPLQDEVIAVQGVEIKLNSTEFFKGMVITPDVTILPVDATDKTYTLMTYDNTVLQQTDDGFLAIGGGSAEIIVITADGIMDWVNLSVTVPVETVSFNFEDITLNRGDSLRLIPTISPVDATDREVNYSSENENVVTVTATGIISAVGAGTTEVLVTAGDVITSVPITVKIPVTHISITTDRRVYSVGDRGSYTIQFTPADATDKSFEVSISGGEAIGVSAFSLDSAGEVVITVTTASGVTGRSSASVIDLVAFANSVFELTNVERANAGLQPLSRRDSLTSAGVVRADETVEVFSHARPDGRSCFTAFDESGVTYMLAGENIAMGQRTPGEVVRGWMDSPGHRANILNKDFGHLGVGVAMDSNGTLYWVQLFTD